MSERSRDRLADPAGVHRGVGRNVRRRWRVGAVAVVMAIACNKPDSCGSNAGSAPRDSDVRWLECTDDVRSAMEATLVARLNIAISNNRADGLTCVTIHFERRPAFFVELVGEHGGRRRRLHGVIAMDRTTALVSLQEGKLHWAQLRGAKVWFETVDLDGDGTDELVVHRGDDRYTVADRIDLVVIRGRELVELKGPGISYEDPDLGDSCRGTLAIERAGAVQHLVVTTTNSNGPSEHCLAPGRHVFALSGERLVEQTPL